MDVKLGVSDRINYLKALKKEVVAREKQILDAIKQDFGKCDFDSYSTEVLMVIEEIDEAIRHVRRWAKPRRVGTGIINFPSKGRIYPEPLGRVLIISPWNYPFMLAVAPLVGAVAAGNQVVLKPSSQTSHTSEVLVSLMQAVFPKEVVEVIEGDYRVSDALLEEPFDLIFFTGSPTIGKKVMAKAAEHLTPVVLELGGKSPTIVDETANIEKAAKRIVWGKFINAGQTCVAPDYVVVHRSVEQALMEAMQRYILAFYYIEDELSDDYPQIINQRHYERLMDLVESDKVFCGGVGEEELCKIHPTIMEDVSWHSPIMMEEIFGPILPVIVYDQIDEVIQEINSRPKPLAFYIFSQSKRMQRYILSNTTSGGGCINDTVMHVSSKHMPFGGVGNSGMGRYHGKMSFDTFSNMRGILHKSPRWELDLKYPPHAAGKVAFIKRLLFK
ncbi:MAG: aldehyde dehydrogenase [Cellulosilyticaceae bacterium]